jgi:Antirepressor regulating drug resistance, predicted signal transduction N-terminal membrane component
MTNMFTNIVTMSITASFIAIAVIIIRMLLKKAPKVFSYALWMAVLLRLVCPFSFISAFSLLNLLKPGVQKASGAIQDVSNRIGLADSPVIDSGIIGINNAVNTRYTTVLPAVSVNPMINIIKIATVIWVIGMAVLLIYSIISYMKLKGNIKTAILVKGNIFETDRIKSPFLCGIINPKIYIPLGISENEMSHILAHEQTHIDRLDYIVKPLAFLICIIHWFNPLIWLSFALMNKDMEMSCDESVIKKMGTDVKSRYSSSLLSLSIRNSGLLLGGPLAFGESNIKSRIKNVIGYKKPAFWSVILVTVITVTLLVIFLANPKPDQAKAPTVYHGYNIDSLMDNKTPYVGNNSKVLALVGSMYLPQGIFRDTIELQTKSTPYGITINLTMKDKSGIVSNGILNSDGFYRNSIILFSLIDNVDVVDYKLKDKTSKESGAIYGFTYTREMAEKLLGEDVRNYSSDIDTLKELIDKVENLSFEDKTSVAPGNEPSVKTETSDNAEPSVNHISSTSPNGVFKAENYGVDKNITAGGLYPSEGIHIIDASSGRVLWGMKPGYYLCSFLWSQDSNYLAISYNAAIYGQAIIIDTKDFSEKLIPIPEEINKRMRENRADPYFAASEWKDDITVTITFKFTGTDDKVYKGSYKLDCRTLKINNLIIDNGSIEG